MDIVQLLQTLEHVGALCGAVSLILYFPIKKKEIKTKIEANNINNLTEIVNRLREEAKANEKQKADDRDRMARSEKQIDRLQEEVHQLRKEVITRDEAIFNVVRCAYVKGDKKKCPVYLKLEQLKH